MEKCSIDHVEKVLSDSPPFSFLSPHLLICDLPDAFSLGAVCFKVISTLCGCFAAADVELKAV